MQTRDICKKQTCSVIRKRGTGSTFDQKDLGREFYFNKNMYIIFRIRLSKYINIYISMTHKATIN